MTEQQAYEILKKIFVHKVPVPLNLIHRTAKESIANFTDTKNRHREREKFSETAS